MRAIARASTAALFRFLALLDLDELPELEKQLKLFA